MRIAIIGAGAMGSIYGSHLSKYNEVYLVDNNKEVVDKINKDGLSLEENGLEVVYRPKAVTSSEKIGKVDLLILFVKSLYSRAALQENKGTIGSNTYVMTLQNGSGHEDILSEVVPVERIIIGTTEDNGAMLKLGYVRHGGTGRTNIGMLVEDKNSMLNTLKKSFDECGFDTIVHDNIQKLIWDKLFTNVSLSAITGVLQVKMGFIAANFSAWNLTKQLVKEAVCVSNAMGLDFDEDTILTKVKKASETSPNGCTSIYADLNNGRLTEVDTISGSVVSAAKKYGVEVPSHEFIVNMVHAMEQRNN
ncbi:ketopantoate reductase family protein [Clostridium estertheticum]|uniref:ketopantoate reductase family protein n=1 Tax=Clostridium estertheticum TaxID=238834 RepID=UPI001C7E0537|nr:ketopantoate reductase family protein [Clostridium estertheticum]MBX4262562.1 ketopantoate reductase family protein [Clostridium estertheticum]WLC71860.1 ketopantoate reductase family protein [Clostridium estertheticum]